MCKHQDADWSSTTKGSSRIIVNSVYRVLFLVAPSQRSTFLTNPYQNRNASQTSTVGYRLAVISNVMEVSAVYQRANIVGLFNSICSSFLFNSRSNKNDGRCGVYKGALHGQRFNKPASGYSIMCSVGAFTCLSTICASRWQH